MKFTNKCAYSLVLASLSVVPAQSFAEQEISPLNASAKVSVGHDDNLHQTDDRQTVAKVIESPYVNLKANTSMSFQRNAYNLGAYLDTSSYLDSSNDNYTDTGFNAASNYAISRRANASIGVSYDHGHDAVGDTDRVAIKPETHDTVGINAGLSYGREESRGRIETYASFAGKRYDEFSSSQKTSDTNTTSLMGAFFYRIRPKTELLFELNHQNIDYTHSQSAASDNQYQKARVGARWQATAKTSGSAKIGYARKDFSEASGRDFNGIDWEISVDWEATPRSLVSFSTSRNVSDSTATTGAGDYITNQRVDLSVLHNWTRRVSTTAAVGFSNDDYGVGSREDDTLNYSVGAEFLLNPSMSIGGSFKGTTRDSNQFLTDYDRNIFSLYVSGKY